MSPGSPPMAEYPRGQRMQTVNLTTQVFVGSTPSSVTIRSADYGTSSELPVGLWEMDNTPALVRGGLSHLP